MGKRGMAAEVGTGAAATVILIIGLLIVVYLILLPNDAREDVLEGRDIDFDEFDDNGDTDSDGNGKDKTILLRNPGIVLPAGIEKIEKKFASVNLLDSSNRETKKLADRIVVSRGLFSNNFEELDFTIENSDNLESLSLFFNIKEAKGSIKVELNGKTVFEGGLDSGDIPIELPVVNLGNRNRLKISGSEVRFAFLSRNEFELRDLELIQEFNIVNKAELRTFEVSRAEAIDDAEMEFFVNCVEVSTDQGILRVFLNRRVIFFGKIVCDASQSKFDVDEDLFTDGTNRLTFEVDKGNYLIEEIELNYDFDEGFNPLYFFTIDEEDFEDINDGDDVKLILKLDKSDEGSERKRADMRINDKAVFMDVNTKSFEKDITEFIVEGENFIKVFPKNEFDLIQLEIRLERD